MDNIKQIIVMGDVLRVSEFSDNPSDKFTTHLYNLFCKQITKAVSVPVKLCLCDSNDIFDRHKFLKLCKKTDLNQENWIRICCGEYTQEAVQYFRECFQNSLIISQEAGALKGIIKSANIPFINIFISSIRFLEDIHWAFQTNVSGIREKLKQYRIDEDEIYYNASLLKTYYGGKNNYEYNYDDNSVLLCGQTSCDLSLIKNGRIVSFLDYKDKILDLSNEYSTIYYKKHPYAQKNEEIENYINAIPNVKFINDNFYKMISSEQIKGVAALSSGCLQEAPYFGKKIHTISQPYVTYYKGEGEYKEDDYVTVTTDYYSPTFWSDILSPVLATRECKYFNFHSKNNFLRNTLNAWWGYEIGNWNKKSQTNSENMKLPDIKDYENKLEVHFKRFINPLNNVKSWISEMFSTIYYAIIVILKRGFRKNDR